jgi:cell division protein FtsL
MKRLGAGALRYVAVRKRSTVVVLILMFASLTAAALAHTSLRLGSIRHGYTVSARMKSFRELEEENRKLRLELSLLRSPERIERIARESLGMRRPDPSEIRLVGKGTTPPFASLSRPR